MDLSLKEETVERKDNPFISSITPLLTWCRIWANSNRQETKQSLPRLWIVEGVSCLGKSTFLTGELITRLRNNGLVEVRNLDYYDLVIKHRNGQDPISGPLRYSFPLDSGAVGLNLEDQTASALAHVAQKHLSPYWSNLYRTFLNNQLMGALSQGLEKRDNHLILFDRCGISDVLYNALFKYYHLVNDKRILTFDSPERIFGIKRTICDATQSKEMTSLTEFQLALRGYISMIIFVPRDHRVIEERMRRRGTTLDLQLLESFPCYVEDQITMFQTFERMAKIMAKEYQEECKSQQFVFQQSGIQIIELDNHEYVERGMTIFDLTQNNFLEGLKLTMEKRIFTPFTYAHPGDAGFDIDFEKPFYKTHVIPPHQLWKVQLKSVVNWDRIPSNVYLQLVIRSSYAKQSLVVLGGVIDHGYTGPIFACIQNLRDVEAFVVPHFPAVQGIFMTYYQPKDCKFLTSTPRGVEGFGSSNQYRDC